MKRLILWVGQRLWRDVPKFEIITFPPGALIWPPRRETEGKAARCSPPAADPVERPHTVQASTTGSARGSRDGE
ncbi:MAG TPA: hypothetical protein VKB76_09155 [Ktedonobacterales bacterium]|nr:hypothetical protein [Ktedonobacterales bacterium]